MPLKNIKNCSIPLKNRNLFFQLKGERKSFPFHHQSKYNIKKGAMYMTQPNYLTPEGEAKLNAELQELKGAKREELSKRLRSAIQMGDLSENADYHKAKEDQGFLEGRIQEIEAILRNTVIIEKSSGQDYVFIGSHVTIQEGSDDPETYHLVGPTEADPRKGKISHESPIGRALMDKKVGDIAEAETPGGKIKFKILKIE
jgi:transcription elongation factor GreA